MSRRLRRNYIWIFALLLFAWILKVSSGASQAINAAEAREEVTRAWYAGANIGWVPGWLVIAAVASDGPRPDARIGDRTTDPPVRLADYAGHPLLEATP